MRLRHTEYADYFEAAGRRPAAFFVTIFHQYCSAHFRGMMKASSPYRNDIIQVIRSHQGGRA
jgi:hypothetical protein